MPDIPVIETERLILRAPLIADFEAWCAFMGDEESARFIGGLQPPPVVWRSMASLLGAWSLAGFSMWSVVEKASGAWIGRLGPWRPHDWPGSEVGWGIIRSRWGCGFALEGATAAMDFAVDKLGWTDIIHTINPANASSQRLAQKLGSINQGPGQMPAPFADHPVDIWGQSAAQWKARRGS